MKYLKMLILLIALIPFLCITIYRFLPVSYDAGACSGGFDTYIYNKNIDELTELYSENNNILSKVSYGDDFTVSYQGRNIYITTSLSHNEDENIINEDVCFKGKRIWTEKYIWKQL
ncbi:MAG: hypothetical protein E7235_04280 [Lachnospiraceae bacterium]|nr:hypothetical protein [Lachnospiraceae bacterium]